MFVLLMLLICMENSLDRLGMAYVDLYQLHYPSKWYIGGEAALAEGLARARERGLCRHIGVCNMNGAQVSST
jgi:diketogulonate reductase-like aldo/keto reductase